MRALSLLLLALAAVLAISGCATTPSPSPIPIATLDLGFAVDCGPIEDSALCRNAVEVAATAKLNPPPIVEARIRRPSGFDDCVTAFHPCGPEAVIVVIQSGDTLQDVPLIPLSGGGWVRLDLVR